MPPTYAKIITYCFANLVFHLLFASNVSAFLHLYSMKEMVIVPPFIWMEDERVAMKNMRLTSLGLVTTGVTVLYAFQAYPILYYWMIEDPTPITELPIVTHVLALLVIFLMITFTISSLAATFYERRCTIPGGTILPRIPLATLIFIILIICGINNYFTGKKFWNLFLTQQICVGVLSPLAVIATSYKLRCYVRGIFQDFVDAMLFMREYLASYISLRSTQVHPIQE